MKIHSETPSNNAGKHAYHHSKQKTVDYNIKNKIQRAYSYNRIVTTLHCIL